MYKLFQNFIRSKLFRQDNSCVKFIVVYQHLNEGKASHFIKNNSEKNPVNRRVFYTIYMRIAELLHKITFRLQIYTIFHHSIYLF